MSPMDNSVGARDFCDTAVQSFRGIWINFAVTNMSTVHRKGVRTQLAVIDAAIIFVRTTDWLRRNEYSYFPPLNLTSSF